jgi:cell division protein ZapA
MEKQAISVEIYHEKYALRTAAPEEMVREIASSVDQRMRMLADAKHVQNREKLAVWTALDLAADLYALNERYEKLLAAIRER